MCDLTWSTVIGLSCGVIPVHVSICIFIFCYVIVFFVVSGQITNLTIINYKIKLLVFHFMSVFGVGSCLPFLFFTELSERHSGVMEAVKTQLETSHQDELNEVTARFLAETAIKVESTRLETETEFQEKLDAMKRTHEEELQLMTEKLKRVSKWSMCSDAKI